jgi:fatty-acyl-CoA synthase
MNGAALPTPAPGDLGLVQFSSGSTREPQGIRLSHANILANAHAFMDRMRIVPSDVVVTWLPLYHDMGLIGTMIAPILGNLPLVLISPLDFVRRPGFWLQSLARNRATISVAPQFAYNLCVRKVRVEELGDADLSPLRILLNGAEPIRADGVRAFEEKLRPLRLRPNVVTPCYGLGEATLAVAMRHPESGLEVVNQGGSELVSSGPALDGLEITIVDLDGKSLAEGEAGEILVRGPSVCGGYLSQGDGASPVDGEGRLRTGDLGFLRGGELFVTGRKKDLIILAGRNLHPQEVEEEAARITGFRQGRIAAFGARDEAQGTEALVLVAEWAGEAADDPAGRVAELRRHLMERIGVAPRDVVLVGRNQIPVTTSGKLRRSATRQAYEAGGFEETLFRLRSSALAGD